MILKTLRLELCPLGREYLWSTHDYAGNYENCRYMVFLPNESIEESAAFLEEVEKEWKKALPGFYEFAILYEDRHIGAISAYFDDSRTEAEFGWILHRDYWGLGLAEEAARTLLDWLQTSFELKRCIAHCDAGNLPSARLMEKLGMKLVSRSGGRKNKGSDEEREELLYRLDLN